MKTTLQMTCECCNARATATFDGDAFEGVVCSKHGPFLSVPTMQVEAMRAVLHERERWSGLCDQLAAALQMHDENERLRYGEKRKAWGGPFVTAETRAALAAYEASKGRSAL